MRDFGLLMISQFKLRLTEDISAQELQGISSRYKQPISPKTFEYLIKEDAGSDCCTSDEEHRVKPDHGFVDPPGEFSTTIGIQVSPRGPSSNYFLRRSFALKKNYFWNHQLGIFISAMGILGALAIYACVQNFLLCLSWSKRKVWTRLEGGWIHSSR